jgi:hypothetical protein
MPINDVDAVKTMLMPFNEAPITAAEHIVYG